MRIETDKDYVYHLWDSPGEMVERVNDCFLDQQMFGDSWYSRWSGRSFGSWGAIKESFTRPWVAGLETVQQMAKEIKAAVPAPKSRRRKARWSEDDGEVCADRLLNADPDYFRYIRRDFHVGTTNVALLTSVGANSSVKHENLFWRGAVTVALIDLLEEANYNVEAWTWWHTRRCWHSGIPNLFTATRVKECGDPLNIESLTNAVSSWFFRYNIFGTVEIGVGRDEMRTPSSSLGFSTQELLPKQREKMDVTQNILELQIDPQALSKDKAIQSAKEILKQIENQ